MSAGDWQERSGALTLVAIFLWICLLQHDYTLALRAAALTLLNNFLFVMSCVAMLDVFYFAFVMRGVLAFTAALLLETSVVRRRVLPVASGFMLGLGTARKWNAAVTLGCAEEPEIPSTSNAAWLTGWATL